MNEFYIKTGFFDGPFDLLYHLIEKHEVDIFDIPIAAITEQYLLYVESLHAIGMDMDSLSGFLVLAATLLNIKAQMLLPKAPKEEAARDDIDDPRAELVSRLIDYKLYKERAEIFREKEQLGILAVYKDRDASLDKIVLPSTETRTSEPLSGIVPVDRLFEIFQDVLARQEKRTDKVRADFGKITLERFTLADRIGFITTKLQTEKRFSFRALFDLLSSRNEMVVTFLALLELIKQQQLHIIQERHFQDIMCVGV